MRSLIRLFALLALAGPAWAAPAPTQLAADISTTDATSYTTAAFAITANRLVTFFVTSGKTGTGINTPSITCHGATWVLAGSESYTSGGGDDRRIFLFRTMLGSSSGAATCAIDFGGQTQLHATWSVQEWSGVDTSGTNGSGAIQQVVTATGAATPSLVTLAAFSSSDNRPLASFRIGTSGSNTPEAGWTSLSNITPAETASHRTIWKDATDDTTPSVAQPDVAWAGIGAEIKAPAAAGGACSALMLMNVGGCP